MALLDTLGTISRGGRVIGTDKARELSLVWLVGALHAVLTSLGDYVEERASRAWHYTTTSQIAANGLQNKSCPFVYLSDENLKL